MRTLRYSTRTLPRDPGTFTAVKLAPDTVAIHALVPHPKQAILLDIEASIVSRDNPKPRFGHALMRTSENTWVLERGDYHPDLPSEGFILIGVPVDAFV